MKLFFATGVIYYILTIIFLFKRKRDKNLLAPILKMLDKKKKVDDENVEC